MKKFNTTPTGKIKISINVPERLVIELDKCRTETAQDRSVWVTSAIMEKISSIKRDKMIRENND